MADKWYVAEGRQTLGPFSAAEMREMIASGQLLPQDLVCREGSQEWVRAGSVPALFGQGALPPRSRDDYREEGPRTLRYDDPLEGYWYAIIWGLLLLPVVGPWFIVLLSSVMYYAWKSRYPRKARTINFHGILAFVTGVVLYCGGWLLVVNLGLLFQPEPRVPRR